MGRRGKNNKKGKRKQKDNNIWGKPTMAEAGPSNEGGKPQKTLLQENYLDMTEEEMDDATRDGKEYYYDAREELVIDEDDLVPREHDKPDLERLALENDQFWATMCREPFFNTIGNTLKRKDMYSEMSKQVPPTEGYPSDSTNKSPLDKTSRPALPFLPPLEDLPMDYTDINTTLKHIRIYVCRKYYYNLEEEVNIAHPPPKDTDEWEDIPDLQQKKNRAKNRIIEEVKEASKTNISWEMMLRMAYL